MSDFIFFTNLSVFHYCLSLIDRKEYEERIKMAGWLFCDREDDPRIKFGDNDPPERDFNNNHNNVVRIYSSDTKERHTDKEITISLYINLGKCKWVFTKSDPDPYPSVPHGHLNNQNNKWPKLDPYLGKVFDGVKKENISKRLNKIELGKIWDNSKFKSFCVETLAWYMVKYTNYTFPEEHLKRLDEEKIIEQLSKQGIIFPF